MQLTTERLGTFIAQVAAASNDEAEGVCANVADEFENDLMDVDGLPPGPFGIFLQLLSDPMLYQKAGVWNFVAVLAAGRHRLDETHFDELTTTFLSHYESYEDPDLCSVVCDFIAGSFPEGKARRLLKRLSAFEIRKPPHLRGFASNAQSE